ncbi:MAG: membrane protein insertase YidC [Opitutaceae bacterium]|jgi:YidC/Oxa1 family membrane protein insertase|nr:membrane protein insertase YidC [Opitutaceae bacterium]
MDKKNTLIGLLLLVSAFAVMYLGQNAAPTSPAPEITRPVGENQAPGPAQSTLPASSPANAAFAALAETSADASFVTLSNDFISARFTNYGGALGDVALKKYSRSEKSAEPYVFNQLHTAPMLALNGLAGLGHQTRYELVSQSATEVVYRTVFENRVEITRRYSIVPGAGAKDGKQDPYRVRHETTFRNITDHTASLPVTLNLGTTALISATDVGLSLNIAAYDGEDLHVIERGDLEGGGFFSALGLRNNPARSEFVQPGSTVWGAVKNQFFTSIYTPAKPGIGITVRRVELPPIDGGSKVNTGLTAFMTLEPVVIAPAAESTVSGDLYVGPKEYPRLAKFERRQDKVMQYSDGWYRKIMLSGFISPAMNTIMNFMHGFVGNWGMAIVLMTLLLKVVTLPFTLAASRSAKRMQKIQPEMQALREKFKDNPQKMQKETMELFKKHRVNPMGGCLPILITMPLFVAFFFMLQSSAELRFQSFLWTGDLSAPDTVLRIPLPLLGSIPLNIMPLLMGATMLFQMRLTPSPSVDNAQVKMMKFMPVFFTLICYNFSCALALYSTINGLFTIGQQLVVNRMKDPALPQAAKPVVKTDLKGRPIINVTPKKK